MNVSFIVREAFRKKKRKEFKVKPHTYGRTPQSHAIPYVSLKPPQPKIPQVHKRFPHSLYNLFKDRYTKKKRS